MRAARKADHIASAVIGSWPLSLSMRKARRLGFHATVVSTEPASVFLRTDSADISTQDSYEAMFHTLIELNQIKVAPPMAVNKFVEDV